MWQVSPSVGDKTPKISFLRGVVLSQSNFHLVFNVLRYANVQTNKQTNIHADRNTTVFSTVSV